jgi:hypothetical protein
LLSGAYGLTELKRPLLDEHAAAESPKTEEVPHIGQPYKWISL